MPFQAYIIMKRSDIPEGVLNASRRLPPRRSSYIKSLQRPVEFGVRPLVGLSKLPLIGVKDGVVTVSEDVHGIPGWLLANVDTGTGPLTRTELGVLMGELAARIGVDTDTPSQSLDVDSCNDHLSFGTWTPDLCLELIQVLAGRPFVLPKGTSLGTTAAFANPGIGFDGPNAGLYLSGDVRMSALEPGGELRELSSPEWSYRDQQGAAITIYTAEGFAITPDDIP